MEKEQLYMPLDTKEQFTAKVKDFKDSLMEFQPKMKDLELEALAKLQLQLVDLLRLLTKTQNSNSRLLQSDAGLLAMQKVIYGPSSGDSLIMFY